MKPAPRGVYTVKPGHRFEEAIQKNGKVDAKKLESISKRVR